MALPLAVRVIWVEQSLATGRSGAGARICGGTGLSRPGEPVACALAGTEAPAVGLGWVAVFCGDEHAPAISATTSSVRNLPAAAKLPFDRGGDLVSRQVVKTVVVGTHPLGEVGARVDRVRLVHRRDTREMLHRRQVAGVARGADDDASGILRVA